MVDKFTQTAIVLLVVVTALFCIGAYIGYIGGAGMEGTDGVVEEHAAEIGGREATELIPTIGIYGDMGEYVGFTLAGVVSGLIAGYLWTGIFWRRENA
jgi:hypothetical protein